MLKLAIEWGKIEKVPPRVSLLPGERRRERVLTGPEERAYLAASTVVGNSIQESHRVALEGIRATVRGEQPQKPEDPYMLRDVATTLLDCGLRPEECYRLRWEHVRDNALHIPYGKTANARRSIPLPSRAAGILNMRGTVVTSEWVFPARTKSGHMAQWTLKKQHSKACKLAKIAYIPFYTFRHTCLTRWAPKWIRTTSHTSPDIAISPRHGVMFTPIWRREGRQWNGHKVRRVGTILGTTTKPYRRMAPIAEP